MRLQPMKGLPVPKNLACMRWWGGLVMLASLAVDQLSKWWIVADVMNPPSFKPITPFFAIVLTHNKGVSFSLLNNLGDMGPMVLTGLAGIIALGMLYWFFIARNNILILGLSMVIGGAVGNIIDRLQFGAVVDFLYFHVAGFAWPAFNMADTFITIGVIFILFENVWTKNKGDYRA